MFLLKSISAVYGILFFVLTRGTPRANSKLPSPKTKMQNSLNDFRHTPYLKRLQNPQVYVCLWNMPETALRIE